MPLAPVRNAHIFVRVLIDVCVCVCILNLLLLADVRVILCDPSCSSSGLASQRIDQILKFCQGSSEQGPDSALITVVWLTYWALSSRDTDIKFIVATKQNLPLITQIKGKRENTFSSSPSFSLLLFSMRWSSHQCFAFHTRRALSIRFVVCYLSGHFA